MMAIRHLDSRNVPAPTIITSFVFVLGSPTNQSVSISWPLISQLLRGNRADPRSNENPVVHAVHRRALQLCT